MGPKGIEPLIFAKSKRRRTIVHLVYILDYGPLITKIFRIYKSKPMQELNQIVHIANIFILLSFYCKSCYVKKE